MPERWPLERFVADGEVRVFRGPKMLAIFDKDDLGMRNVVAVSLTDAGIPCKDVAQCFGLSVPYTVKGAQRNTGGRLGSPAFGEDPREGHAVAERFTQFGFYQAEDQQGDADHGDQRLDAGVVVQEHRRDPEGLLQVPVALLDDPLVLVDLQYFESRDPPLVPGLVTANAKGRSVAGCRQTRKRYRLGGTSTRAPTTNPGRP